LYFKTKQIRSYIICFTKIKVLFANSKFKVLQHQHSSFQPNVEKIQKY